MQIIHLNGNLWKFHDDQNILTSGSTEVQLINIKSMQKIPSKSAKGAVKLFQKTSNRSNARALISSTENANGNDKFSTKSLMEYYEVRTAT